MFPEALRIDLLAPDVLQAYQARPERLRDRIATSSFVCTVVIDEIQKVPPLLDVVHALLEQQPTLRYVLTGSSARKLRHGAAILLGGRLVSDFMPRFIAAELGPVFDVSRALEMGLVPLILQPAEPQASQLNLSALAREADISRKRTKRYLFILEDLLLSYRLPVFKKPAQRNLVQQQKSFYSDLGDYRTLRPTGPLGAPRRLSGWHSKTGCPNTFTLSANCDARGGNLSFWRTRSVLQVDCVLYGPDLFWAIEVKRRARIDRSDLAGLKAFGVAYPQAESLLLSLAPESMQIDSIRCELLESWLRRLTPTTTALH